MITTTWTDLVTVALLGTDRRDPPAPPVGPIGDVVADAQLHDPARLMLATVGAVTAARRSAWRPLPDDIGRPSVAPDPRPITPPPATQAFADVRLHVPLMMPEFLDTIHTGGWRLAPELVVPVLQLARGRPDLAGGVARIVGPVGQWLMQHWPALSPPTGRRAAAPAGPPPITPELEALLAAPPEQLAETVAGGLLSGDLDQAHRAVLVNLLVRVPRRTLAVVLVRLDAASQRDRSPLIDHLVTVARVRLDALATLDPPQEHA